MSRVLLINGSPNEFGCTYTALSEVKKSLEKNGVAAEIYYLGKPAIRLYGLRRMFKTRQVRV